MINSSLILTLVSDDKPGVVETVSQTVTAHSGSWLKSRMSYMSGKFAGIIAVSINNGNLEALLQDLEALKDQGIQITTEQSTKKLNNEHCQEYQLQLTSLDRPGIIREVSQVLAEKNVNLIELSSEISSAPMSGEPLFEATALVAVPQNVSIDDLTDRLESIANDLMIEFS